MGCHGASELVAALEVGPAVRRSARGSEAGRRRSHTAPPLLFASSRESQSGVDALGSGTTMKLWGVTLEPRAHTAPPLLFASSRAFQPGVDGLGSEEGSYLRLIDMCITQL